MTPTSATNTTANPFKVGKANTHTIHMTSGLGLANCQYNGAGRPMRTVWEIAPGATVEGHLCGKCFRWAGK